MRRRRIVVLSMFTAMFVGAGVAPAFADVPPLCGGVGTTECTATAEQAAANEAATLNASGSDVASAEPVTLPVTYGEVTTLSNGLSVTTWKPCTIALHIRAAYSKPSGSFAIAESGSDYTSTTCPSNAIDSFTVTSLVQDYGVPPASSMHSQNNSGSSTAGGQAYSSVGQGVSLYSFPTDYHAYGSTMVWSFSLHIAYTSNGKGATDICYQDQANYGGSVNGGPVACP